MASNTIEGPFYSDQDEMEESEEAMDDDSSSRSGDKEFDHRLLVKKTRPETCDQERWLYTLGQGSSLGVAYNKSMDSNCSRYNLIFYSLYN